MKFSAPMIAAALPCLLLAGCGGVPRLVTARVEIAAGTNRVTVIQPKDTTIDSLRFDPAKGALEMKGYASAGNAEAIAAARAQAEAQAQVFGRALDLVGQLSAAFARMYGLPVAPIESAPTAQGRIPALPPGMKWTLGTNGIPTLAPRDDPSRPAVEVE